MRSGMLPIELTVSGARTACRSSVITTRPPSMRVSAKTKPASRPSSSIASTGVRSPSKCTK